eukprot:COSAG02_NODE_32953_length_507_cov_215.531863_1_plen_25_part_10
MAVVAVVAAVGWPSDSLSLLVQIGA